MFSMVPLPRTLEAALRDAVDPKPQVRASAVRDLAAHAEADRKRVVSALERALQDDSAHVRAHAAELLGDLEATEALAGLLVSVEDEVGMVREQAIASLGRIGDPRAQARLERALHDDRPEVRFQATMAYPRVAPRDRALEALVAATKDADPLVAHVAFRMAEELAEEGSPCDPPIVERALSCLTHASPRVRAVAAVIAAGAVGDEKAKGVIVALAAGTLADADHEDVIAAIELVGELGLEAARAPLERRAFGGLLGLGRDPFRWHARTALARLGHERACKELLSELGARSFETRSAAVSAVGRARLREARGALLALRDAPDKVDPDVVAEALARLDESSEGEA